jgi:hypothetical protein
MVTGEDRARFCTVPPGPTSTIDDATLPADVSAIMRLASRYPEVAADELVDVVAACHQDLLGVPVAALPELVERLAVQRVLDLLDRRRDPREREPSGRTVDSDATSDRDLPEGADHTARARTQHTPAVAARASERRQRPVDGLPELTLIDAHSLRPNASGTGAVTVAAPWHGRVRP